MKKALFLGILASFFFAFTFVLNRSMNLSGGYWLWSAALRYLFTLPILFVCLLKGSHMKKILDDIKRNPAGWFLYSTIGFGLFYAPLTAASVFAESWFTAATWQITIVCGVLLTPFFGRKIPVKNLGFAFLILCGIAIMQIPKFGQLGTGMLAALALIIVAAFSYPMGNRKMMVICGGNLSTLERVFGMTLCSMPFWIVCAVIAGLKAGMPSSGQVFQSFLVALFSGVIATVLFFKATDMVRNNAKELAIIEATQSGEVIFSLLLGVLILHDSMPAAISVAGLVMIIAGMIMNSLKS